MKRGWKEKLSADCLRQLEYHRKAKEFSANVPDNLSEFYRFVSGGGFNEFERATAHLAHAKPHEYESVVLSAEVAEFLNSSWPQMPWGQLTAGQTVRLPPNGARIVREFEKVMVFVEQAPWLRGIIYAAIAVFGDYAISQLTQFAEQINLPDLQTLNAAAQKDTMVLFASLGKLLENLGKKLEGKPISKGKVDREKRECINLIREHQIEKLSWVEMRDALEFGGVHFADADALRLFAHRVRRRKRQAKGSTGH